MTTTAQHVLTLDRVFNAPVANVWRCWAESELFSQWFLPLPWRVSDAKVGLRNGGELSCVMNGPNGGQLTYPFKRQFPNSTRTLQERKKMLVESADLWKRLKEATGRHQIEWI